MPSGPARVSVAYVGMRTANVGLEVLPGAVVQQEFELFFTGAGTVAGQSGRETVQLDAFSVVADSEMSAQAIAQNERKSAANIRQIVAFEEFGDRGAENVGDLMRFLPGVGIVDGGQTASSIALRGFPDSNTALQLDGAELASGRGNSRTQSVLDVPMANISRVEVNKVPVPDQPASGIGGSVNIISKSGFESKRPVFNYKVYLLSDSYSGLTLKGGPRGPTELLSPKYQQPSFDFTYLLPVNKRFGFTLSGLAAASQGPAPSQSADRELLAELLILRTAIRRYAVNVNQAVAALHSTGDAPIWLSRAVLGAHLAVVSADEATQRVARRLR